MKPSMGLVNFFWGNKPNYVCVGDIVGFARPKKSVKLVHRVIDIDRNGMLYIKGDNAPEIDCVPFSEVYFKVTRFKRIIG